MAEKCVVVVRARVEEEDGRPSEPRETTPMNCPLSPGISRVFSTNKNFSADAAPLLLREEAQRRVKVEQDLACLMKATAKSSGVALAGPKHPGSG